jgi:hypothetical protein
MELHRLSLLIRSFRGQIEAILKTNYGHLGHYRRMVAEHYAAVRGETNLELAATTFRAARDRLFGNHPLSPIEPEQLVDFSGIPYGAYDPAWRIKAAIDLDVEADIFDVDLPEGGFRYQRFGRVRFKSPAGEDGELSLFWILGYGGGVFLPFGDATNRDLTYGGGRYLYDTIKGADLGVDETEIVLDFNYAYHPSCFYSPRWVCPLSPRENRLSFGVPVGELAG